LDSITAALVVAGALGLWFSTTRLMAVCSLALLCAFRPWLAALVIFGVSLAFYIFKVHQR
jgi:hypothetical protein